VGLPWIRLDTQFPTNPKVLMLVEDKKWRSTFVWVASLGYSGAHGTDGFLPAACLPFIHATKREATDLVEVGLWHAMQGGWEINGWTEYQLSSEETALRSKNAKLAAHARWAKKKGAE
jgi:hypothetical protein